MGGAESLRDLEVGGGHEVIGTICLYIFFRFLSSLGVWMVGKREGRGGRGEEEPSHQG